MKKLYFSISLVLTVVAFLLTYFYFGLHKSFTIDNFELINKEIVGFYGLNLRGNLFSGFLALGGFIFSLKAFILVTMKQNVYDSEIYETQWLEKNDNVRDGEAYFLPLKELNLVLYMTVLLSIFSSIINITIGLLPNILVVYVCIFSAFIAIIYLVKSLRLIKGNLDTWFDYLSQKKFDHK